MEDMKAERSIYKVVKDIQNGLYRLPNIQRSYVWDLDRVIKLLDSIMSGYPIGALMVWHPPEEEGRHIAQGLFTLQYDSTLPPRLSDAPYDKDAYLVLDGQQRLQSLYISLVGIYDHKAAYLEIDQAPGNTDDIDYGFEFLTPAEAAARPNMVLLRDIITAAEKGDIMPFARQMCAKVASMNTETALSEDDLNKKEAVIWGNIERFRNQFYLNSTLLFQTVEQNQDYDHILEIFERVNSAGIVLSKSDLLFATIKLRLEDMEQKFQETILALNEESRYNFNTDFIIKAALVIFDQKAKYDVAKLKNDAFVDRLKNCFDDLQLCMVQMKAWLHDDARIQSSRFLRSQSALIPILDYMMLSGNHTKPDGENARAMAQYLYMAFFRNLFSRAGDNVLDRLHDKILHAVQMDKSRFPIEAISEYMVERQGTPYILADYYFGSSHDLMLNIVQDGVTALYGFTPATDLRIEVDHIFPKSRLNGMGLGDVADRLGNFRLLGRRANRRKSDALPDQNTDFFGRNTPELEPLYYAALDQARSNNLTRETFLAFAEQRATLIRKEVAHFLDLTTEG